MTDRITKTLQHNKNQRQSGLNILKQIQEKFKLRKGFKQTYKF